MVGEIREPTPEERVKLRTGARYRPERPRPTWGEREAKAEEAARVTEEKARVVEDVGRYGGGLREILNEFIASGAIYPERAREIWEQTSQYIAASGLTPALPFYKEIQWRGIEKEARGQYERFKESILATDWSYSEKLSSLLRAHPRAGDVKVFRQIKADLFASLSPEERKGRTAEVESGEERQWRAQMARYAPAPSYAYPEPMRYEPAFEEMRAGLAGPEPWRDWFESRYSTLVRRFKAITAEPTEKGWAEYLKARKPELREQWWGLGAYRRGERPGAFQPKIRTVGF